MRGRPLISICFLGFVLSATASAQTSTSEIDQLRREVVALRAENHTLRQRLATSVPVASMAAAAVPPSARSVVLEASSTADTSSRTVPARATAQTAPAAVDRAAPQVLTHWITSSSSKRHNSGCRWYANSSGRPCSENEGIACKVCGG